MAIDAILIWNLMSGKVWISMWKQGALRGKLHESGILVVSYWCHRINDKRERVLKSKITIKIDHEIAMDVTKWGKLELMTVIAVKWWPLPLYPGINSIQEKEYAGRLS